MHPPWASLYGTYRSAEDVPGYLAALRSPGGDALGKLASAVLHQGTRWQVSAYVVPYLVELIDDPATPDRANLTWLLRDVGVGPRDDRDLPFDPRAGFAGAAAVTEAQEALVIERVYRREEELGEDWVDLADACARKWEADAYWAAAAHVDAYRRWLADADPRVASRAAELLAWFPPAEATIAALLAVDGDDLVRASANLALAHHRAPPAHLLDHHAAVVRLTAAVALAYQLGPDLPDRALDLLVEAKDHDPLPEVPPGWRRAQRGFVALALQRLGLG
jgi:hypothetical protein